MRSLGHLLGVVDEEEDFELRYTTTWRDDLQAKLQERQVELAKYRVFDSHLDEIPQFAQTMELGENIFDHTLYFVYRAEEDTLRKKEVEDRVCRCRFFCAPIRTMIDVQTFMMENC